MKVKKAAALFMIMVFLLTAAGCKYKRSESETTSTTEVKSATTEISSEEISEDYTYDQETVSLTETNSAESDSSVTDSTAETEKSREKESTVSEKKETEKENKAESEESVLSTTKKGFELSTLVNISSLVDINSYTKATTEKQTEKQTTKAPEKQGEKFFDDAIFVGDSVTLGLKNYVTSERNAGRSCLGKAQFLCAGSLGYINSYNNVLEPTYNGSKVRIEDGIKQSGAKKAFIMLGMNDFTGYAEGTAEKAIRGTLDNIIKKNPNVTIYIESVTPILKAKEHDSFTNANVNAFNKKLKSICTEYGITYVDINSVMKTSEGCLNPDYCGDASAMGIHMSYDGCKAWIKYLINNF